MSKNRRLKKFSKHKTIERPPKRSKILPNDDKTMSKVASHEHLIEPSTKTKVIYDRPRITFRRNFSDGSSYKGDRLLKLRHGFGKHCYKNDCTYVGEYRNGARHGYG